MRGTETAETMVFTSRWIASPGQGTCVSAWALRPPGGHRFLRLPSLLKQKLMDNNQDSQWLSRPITPCQVSEYVCAAQHLPPHPNTHTRVMPDLVYYFFRPMPLQVWRVARPSLFFILVRTSNDGTAQSSSGQASLASRPTTAQPGVGTATTPPCVSVV